MIALITDSHIGARSDSQVFNEYMLSYWTDQFIPYLVDNNITTVLHLGDVFDRRKYVNFGTLNTWRKKVFEVLEHYNIQMNYIIGNHDCYHKNTNSINSVKELLARYSNTTIYESPCEVTFDGVKVLIIPWINNYNQEDALAYIEKSNLDYCFGHFEIEGFKIQQNVINHEKGIKADVFKNFNQVYSGHFHHSHRNGNINYLGSPYETNWADFGDPRGFHILDLPGGHLKFLPNRTTMFRKIFYNDQKKFADEIIKENEEAIKDITGKYAKIIVNKKTDFHTFDTFVDEIQKLNPADLTIVENFTDEDMYGEYSNTLDQSKDAVGILGDYIKEMELEDYAPGVMTLFHDVYTEAIKKETVNEQ